MEIQNENDIVKAIKEDEWMMNILFAVKSLDLPDWWICAGFVRSKIWDMIHDYNERTPLPDIDVIYFDLENTSDFEEKAMEATLTTLLSNVPWSVKNQARMHIKSNLPPYSSSVDGISKFPETATALGVKLDDKNDIVLAAPWGVHDVINLVVKPTPLYNTDERIKIYHNRVSKKNWDKTWTGVRIYNKNIPTI